MANSTFTGNGSVGDKLVLRRCNPSLLRMIRLLIATRNAHKLQEIRTMLGAGFQCLSLREFPDAPKVVEDAGTFKGNARKKAEMLVAWIKGSPAESNESPLDFVLADDSGLEVDALNGAPGVHSARFAAVDSHSSTTNSSDADNNAKLLRLLEETPPEQRTARFRCVLACTDLAHGPTRFCEGTCEGRIGFHGRGGHGFGYDPLFVPEGMTQTFAELGEEAKNRISHRSKALEKLRLMLAAV